jgi:hypothetical protein
MGLYLYLSLKVEKETLKSKLEMFHAFVSLGREANISKHPDRPVRADCDPSLIMTRCRGISCC